MMKKTLTPIIWLLITLFCAAPLSIAAEIAPDKAAAAAVKKADADLISAEPFASSATLNSANFSYEPGEEEAVASLNRIAGTIDRGYTSEEQSYKSVDQRKTGPLAKDERANSSSSSSY